MKVVYLKWRDHESNSGDWISKTDFQEWISMPIALAHTVGLLIYENDEFVVITQTITAADREKDEEFSESIKIVKSAIVEREVLTEIPLDIDLDIPTN